MVDPCVLVKYGGTRNEAPSEVTTRRPFDIADPPVVRMDSDIANSFCCG